MNKPAVFIQRMCQNKHYSLSLCVFSCNSVFSPLDGVSVVIFTTLFCKKFKFFNPYSVTTVLKSRCFNLNMSLLSEGCVSSHPSNPPLSEEMLPSGEWMCHRCNVRKKVRHERLLCSCWMKKQDVFVWTALRILANRSFLLFYSIKHYKLK